MVSTFARAVFLLIAASPGQAPGSPQLPLRDNTQTEKVGTAVIRGQVVAADTGQPLRNANVSVYSAAVRESHSTMTDGSGRYELKALPAARYSVNAGKANYIGMSYGQPRPGQAGRPLTLSDGQVIEKVDFALPRASVIAGRVVDEFGEPVADVQVNPQRYQNSPVRRLMPGGRMSMTNDLGEFRLYGLTPGDYYVSARVMASQGNDEGSGYARTFYPSAVAEEMAEKLTVDVGQTLGDIVITLSRTKLARIIGTALDSQGHPFVGMVSLAKPNELGFLGPGSGPIRADGSFSIDGVAPGIYNLQVRSMSGSTEYATADVTVSGADIIDVQLTGIRMPTISGRIVIDPAAALAFRPSLYRVMAALEVGGLIGGTVFGPSTQPDSVREDFTFSVKTLPGKVRLSLLPLVPSMRSGENLPVIRTIRVSGTDVTDDGIELKPLEDLQDVTIEITNRVTHVSGRVVDSKGGIVKDYFAVIFPRDRERWARGSRYIRIGVPDQEGRFKIDSIPPGDYEGIAVEKLEPGESTNRDFLESVRDKGRRFTIAEGETKTLDLEIKD